MYPHCRTWVLCLIPSVKVKMVTSYGHGWKKAGISSYSVNIIVVLSSHILKKREAE